MPNLDYDKTNDDPSNLVIMGKYQHVSHHWKQKVVESAVTILDDNKGDNGAVPGLPVRKPTICERKGRGYFFIQYSTEDVIDGKAQRCGKRVNSYRGKHMKSIEAAERAIKGIWPFMNWDAQ